MPALLILPVSPPTRGWSVLRREHALPVIGVPAYAGMVPPCRAPRPRPRRCPRLRGDGPYEAARAAGYTGVSPPTRGWSATVVWMQALGRGVPAYAGMVLSRPVPCGRDRGCPRLRGDGPRAPLFRRRLPPVSPPTRGWSLVGHQPVRQHGGVPAYAGMVRRRRRPDRAAARCPRLRGDGPPCSVNGLFAALVSPPTRGWSWPRPPRGRSGRGVPAYAGMVPAKCGPASQHRGCPRLRGDGP